jgi:hypothetical protein
MGGRRLCTCAHVHKLLDNRGPRQWTYAIAPGVHRDRAVAPDRRLGAAGLRTQVDWLGPPPHRVIVAACDINATPTEKPNGALPGAHISVVNQLCCESTLNSNFEDVKMNRESCDLGHRNLAIRHRQLVPIASVWGR